jgi:hypothetical protein
MIACRSRLQQKKTQLARSLLNPLPSLLAERSYLFEMLHFGVV